MVIPLVVSSIMLGIATAGDPAYLKKMGVRIFPYFVITTSVAVTIGACLALWIQPGQYIDSQLLTAVVSQGNADRVCNICCRRKGQID